MKSARLGQTPQERAEAAAQQRARELAPEGAPSQEQIAQGRDALVRMRQAYAEGEQCGDAETLCSVLPHIDSIRPGAAGYIDQGAQVADFLMSSPVYVMNGFIAAVSGPDAPQIPTVASFTGLTAESPWCGTVMEFLPAAIEYMSEEDVQEHFNMSKSEAQTLLCQVKGDLTDMVLEPSAPQAFPIECSPGYTPAFETPEGRKVGSNERKPPGTRFVGCELSFTPQAEVEREIETILAESAEEYRLAYDEIRAQQALGILDPVQAERARRAAAATARARASERIDEARGIYTFPPLDIGEDEAKAAAAGGLAGLAVGALLVWALTKKK